jgi:hypothetical protein
MKQRISYDNFGNAYVEQGEDLVEETERLQREIDELKQHIANQHAADQAQDDYYASRALLDEKAEYKPAYDKLQEAYEFLDTSVRIWQVENQIPDALSIDDLLTIMEHNQSFMDEFKTRFPGIDPEKVLRGNASTEGLRTALDSIAEEFAPPQSDTALLDAVFEATTPLDIADHIDGISDAQEAKLMEALRREEEKNGWIERKPIL